MRSGVPARRRALSFLRAHPGQVSPITVTLYGNDWLPLLLDTCKGKAACARKHAPSATASFASRLGSILQQLRAAAPTAEIIVTGAWNPDPDQLQQLKPLYRSLEALDRARSGGVAAAGRAHAPGVQPVREPSSAEGPALRAHLHLLEGRSASDRRRVPRDGRRPHGCFGLPAEVVGDSPPIARTGACDDVSSKLVARQPSSMSDARSVRPAIAVSVLSIAVLAAGCGR